MYRAKFDKKAMELPKTTPTSILAVAALGLVLGLATTPVMANPADENGCHTHKPCEPSSGTNSMLDVEVVAVDNSLKAVTCDTGTTPADKIAVNFDGCPSVPVELIGNSSCATTPIDLELFMIYLKNTKNETSVSLFMRDQYQAGNGSVYQTEALDVIIHPVSAGNTVFEITGDEGYPITESVNLKKIHQPCRGDVVGSISVGKLVFTSQ